MNKNDLKKSETCWLFVCLGNICRSPTAEAIADKLAQEKGVQLYSESAGTSAYHVGEEADSRSQEAGKKRGYEFKTYSQRVKLDDYIKFDAIFAMDKSNYRDLIEHCPIEKEEKKIFLITDFLQNPLLQAYKTQGIPDPYFGHDGFDLVIDLLEDSIGFLLDTFKESIVSGSNQNSTDFVNALNIIKVQKN